MIIYEIVNSSLKDVKLLDEDVVIQDIEEVIAEFQLVVTQKTTLSTMRGSIHYHLKQGSKPGVLEVTYWPVKKRLFVEIHDNRLFDWNRDIILPFAESLAERFGGVVISQVI